MNVVSLCFVIILHGVIAQTKYQDLTSIEENYSLAKTTVSGDKWSDKLTVGSIENTVSSNDIRDEKLINTETPSKIDENLKSTEASSKSKINYITTITQSSTFPDSISENSLVVSTLLNTNFEENQNEASDIITSSSTIDSKLTTYNEENIKIVSTENSKDKEFNKFTSETPINYDFSASSLFTENYKTTTNECMDVPTINNSSLKVTVSSFKANFSWTSPNDTNCVENYNVYIQDLVLTTTEPSITIENLTACSDYEVAVCAVYANITGANATIKFQTLIPDDFNTYGVESLEVQESNNTLLITWRPQDTVKKCITDYYLQWTDIEDNVLIGEINLNSYNTSYEIPIIGCMNITIQITPKAEESKNGQNNSTTHNTKPRIFSTPELVNNPIPDKTEINVTFKAYNASINKCKAETIIVNCEAPKEINSNFSWIISKVFKNQEIEDPNSNYAINIDGLSPFTNYTCNGIIRNEGGDSDKAIFDFQTKEEVPSKPQQLQIINVTAESFTVDWIEPENITGIMTHYVLQIYNYGPQYTLPSNCDNNTNNSFTIKSENSTYIFKNASSYYKYSIILYGVDGAGDGESATAEIITAASTPDSVLNAQMANPVYSDNENYSGTVEVTFDSPCNINGPFKHYEINYEGIRSNFSIDTNTKYIKNTTVSISLLPDRNYSISIQISNENYTSNAVRIPKFHSKSGVPHLEKNMSAPTTNDTSSAYFTLRGDSFSNKNGDIISYCLILLISEENSTYGFWNGTNETWPSLPQNSKQLTPNFWNPFEDNIDAVNFIIGNNKTCVENYCNKPLNENTKYWLLVRALTSSAYKDSTLLHFHTEMLDELNLGLILGLIFGLLALVVLIIFLIVLWRRRKQLQIPEEEKRISIIPEAIPVRKFSHYYSEIKENYNIIKSQFVELGNRSKEFTGEVSFALLSENKRKNRYTNILPYDFTRVSLKIDEDDEISSDYINASYIKGYTGKIEYIATQGPLESTVRDFWRMILQENVSIIAMVSQFVEQTKEKCYQYFPNNHQTSFYGENLEVKCLTELHFGTYCIRTLQICKNTEQREVVHMQFLEWPDFGVPQGTDNMLQFCNQLREKVNKEGGLIAVHCSAGVGRTGTLIALDILLQTIDDHRDINIYKTVFDLRKQRTNMVQTEKQYMFIHSCIKDYIETPPIQPDISVHTGERIYENMEVLRSSLKKNLIQNEVESAL